MLHMQDGIGFAYQGHKIVIELLGDNTMTGAHLHLVLWYFELAAFLSPSIRLFVVQTVEVTSYLHILKLLCNTYLASHTLSHAILVLLALSQRSWLQRWIRAGF